MDVNVYPEEVVLLYADQRKSGFWPEELDVWLSLPLMVSKNQLRQAVRRAGQTTQTKETRRG